MKGKQNLSVLSYRLRGLHGSHLAAHVLPILQLGSIAAVQGGKLAFECARESFLERLTLWRPLLEESEAAEFVGERCCEVGLEAGKLFEISLLGRFSCSHLILHECFALVE